MISEVENIMNGQVVRTANADKAIGVSTANLMPNEKGEVPLSKQTAFQIINPNLTQNASLLTEELDLMPPSNKIVGEQVAPATPAITFASVPNDTINVSPVDVVAPTQLDGLDIDSIIPNIPLISEEDVNKEEIGKTIENKPAELPKMPETILAEEPTGINDKLFVNSESISTPVIPIIDENVEKTSTEENLTQKTSSFENVAQETFNTPTIPSVGDVNKDVSVEENITQTISPFGSVAPQTMNTQTLSSINELKQETSKTESLTENMPEFDNNSQELVPTLKEPTLQTNEELNKNTEEMNINKQLGSQNEKDIKFDKILNKLEEIRVEINNIKDKIDLNANNKMIQTPVLPQEPTSVVNNNLPSVETVKKQEEFVDALSQIGTLGELKIDEAPIKGGMFI